MFEPDILIDNMNKYLVPAILFSVILIGGIIILKSSDSQVNEPAKKVPEIQHAHGFAVDISDGERLLIATHHGLLQFKDGVLSQIGVVTDDLMGFTPHPTDSNIYFSSGHPARGGNLGFQKSADGGNTWEKVSDGMDGPVDFHSMTISQVNPNLMYGYFGAIQHSTDGGQNWKFASDTIQPYSLSTDPQQENVVYAATQNGVQVSEDNAETWKSYSAALDNGAVSFFSVNPTGDFALAFSETLGGLGKTNDKGQTWKMIPESFGSKAVLFVAYSKSAPSTVYALNQANSIFKSTDDGETWTKIH